MKGLKVVFVVLMVMASVKTEAQLRNLLKKKPKFVYEEVDTEDMIRRFVSKPVTGNISIEGIYSVSSIVTKRSKALLSSEMKEKIVDRKDNYARVAIIRDRGESEHDFIQLSLTQTGSHKFPIVGHLSTLSEGRAFLCKHTEPDGEVLTFTFSYAGDSNILEGTYTKVDGSKTITYTISLLKTYPKAEFVTTQ